MDTDGYYEFWLSSKTTLVSECISFPLFLIFIRPLYEFAKLRNPMLLLYSKSIGMAIYLFFTPVGISLKIFSIYPSWWIYVSYVNNVPYMAVRFHLLAMAMNRFFSVYLPFKYHRMNKRGIMKKICFALWLIALILAPPAIYVGMNQITTFPLILLSRANIEQYCVYLACLFYVLMAAKLISMKFYMHGEALEGSTHEKDYYKISAVYLLGILPFLLGILTLTLMKHFIVMGIYQRNHLLQDILVTFNIPFIHVANFSEEICLLILSADFRAIFMANLSRIGACFLKTITFGRFTMETLNSTSNENGLMKNNTTINGTNTGTDNVVVTREQMPHIEIANEQQQSDWNRASQLNKDEINKKN